MFSATVSHTAMVIPWNFRKVVRLWCVVTALVCALFYVSSVSLWADGGGASLSPQWRKLSYIPQRPVGIRQVYMGGDQDSSNIANSERSKVDASIDVVEKRSALKLLGNGQDDSDSHPFPTLPPSLSRKLKERRGVNIESKRFWDNGHTAQRETRRPHQNGNHAAVHDKVNDTSVHANLSIMNMLVKPFAMSKLNSNSKASVFGRKKETVLSKQITEQKTIKTSQSPMETVKSTRGDRIANSQPELKIDVKELLNSIHTRVRSLRGKKKSEDYIG